MCIIVTPTADVDRAMPNVFIILTTSMTALQFFAVVSKTAFAMLPIFAVTASASDAAFGYKQVSDTCYVIRN